MFQLRLELYPTLTMAALTGLYTVHPAYNAHKDKTVFLLSVINCRENFGYSDTIGDWQRCHYNRLSQSPMIFTIRRSFLELSQLLIVTVTIVTVTEVLCKRIRLHERSKTPFLSLPEVLALKHESRILGQWSSPVSGSRKSQASSPWAKQHIV